MTAHTKVLFVTSGGPEVASSRLRVFNLLDYFDEKFQYTTMWPRKQKLYEPEIIRRGHFTLQLLRQAGGCDVVYLQKLLLPKPVLSLLTKIVPKLIFDIDDALYTAPPWEDIDQNRIKKVNYTLKYSDLIIAGSPAIQKYATKFSKNTKVLITPLPAEPFKKRKEKRHNDSSDVTIGWIGNPENLRYLEKIKNELEDILNKYTCSKLIVITSGDLPVSPLSERADVEYLNWSLDTQLDDLCKSDICIRPLIDDEWTRAKGGFTSVLQPMALGIPVIVTPVAMLSTIVEHGKSGFHAHNRDDWMKYLSVLIENPDIRHRIGKNAHSAIEENRFWANQRAKDVISTIMEET